MGEEKLYEHIRLMKSGHHKLCECSMKIGFYYDFGMYKCQYCNGLLTDLDRVKRIIEYNKPL